MKSGLAAYAQTQTRALSGRPLESEALAKAARLLESARTRPGDPGALGEALDYNLKLWTVFQADLAEPGNPLPDNLKGELLSLSLFMDKSAARLLAGYDEDVLRAMIDVNRSLAKIPPPDT